MSATSQLGRGLRSTQTGVTGAPRPRVSRWPTWLDHPVGGRSPAPAARPSPSRLLQRQRLLLQLHLLTHDEAVRSRRPVQTLADRVPETGGADWDHDKLVVGMLADRLVGFLPRRPGQGEGVLLHLFE